jgi:hypothetical protein
MGHWRKYLSVKRLWSELLYCLVWAEEEEELQVEMTTWTEWPVETRKGSLST